MPRVTEEMLKEGLMVFHVHAFPESGCGWVEAAIYRGSGTDKYTGAAFGEFIIVGCQVFSDSTWRDGKEALSDRSCWRDQRSLMDMGIIPNDYNHHRTFTTWKEACEYVMQVAEVPEGTVSCPIEPFLVRMHNNYSGV